MNEIYSPEDLEEVLSIKGRRSLGRSTRKRKGKLKAARKRRANRRADKKRLTRRSRKGAISQVRNKVAGKQGKKYSELSPAQKSMIDKRVKKRKKMVDRLSRKGMPGQRKKDIARLRREDLDVDFVSMLNETPAIRHHVAHCDDGSVKLDKRFRAFRDGPVNQEPLDMQKLVDEIVSSITLDEAKTEKYLEKRAFETDTDFEDLKEVYSEGLEMWKPSSPISPDKFSMNLVNRFIEEKAMYQGMDKKMFVSIDLLSKMLKDDPSADVGELAFRVTRYFNSGYSTKEIEAKYHELYPSNSTNKVSDTAKNRLYKKYLGRAPRG